MPKTPVPKNLYLKHARLVDPSHKLPWHGRLFGVGTDHPGYELVDPNESFTYRLIQDGSIMLEEPAAPAAAEPAPAPHPGPREADEGQKPRAL